MHENKKEILSFSLYAAKVMLINGGEIYRVEDMINRICKSRDVTDISVHVTTTLIIISCESMDNYCLTRRIRQEGTNLDKITKVNDLARKFTSSDMSVEYANKVIKQIENEKTSHINRFISAGFASACFTVLFGGDVREFFVAFFTGSISQIIFDFSVYLLDTPFLPNMIAGFCVGISASIFEKILNVDLQSIVIGAIMPFVPGVVLTNAVRDFLSGDLLSGSSRFVEAIVIATTIAFGVASAISVCMHIL